MKKKRYQFGQVIDCHIVNWQRVTLFHWFPSGHDRNGISNVGNIHCGPCLYGIKMVAQTIVANVYIDDDNLYFTMNISCTRFCLNVYTQLKVLHWLRTNICTNPKKKFDVDIESQYMSKRDNDLLIIDHRFVPTKKTQTDGWCSQLPTGGSFR